MLFHRDRVHEEYRCCHRLQFEDDLYNIDS